MIDNLSEGPAANVDAEDIMARLERFERSSRSAMTRLEAIQAEITTLVTTPKPVAVHAEMDAAGLVTTLTIDKTVGQTMDAEMLERDLNSALRDAARRRPAQDPAQLRAAAETLRATARIQGENPTELVRALFASSAINSNPEPRWNDQHTVAVTLQAGIVGFVKCDGPWLRTAAMNEIAAQVRQAVNHAVAGTNGTTGGAR